MYADQFDKYGFNFSRLQAEILKENLVILAGNKKDRRETLRS